MSINRILGILIVTAGLSGLLLSAASDQIGLSLTGGTRGWGFVNAAGSLGGGILLVAGILLSFKVSSRTPQDTSKAQSGVGNDGELLFASSIPEPAQTVEGIPTIAPKQSYIGIQSPVLHNQPIPTITSPVQPAAINQDNNEAEDDYEYECPTCGSDIDVDEDSCSVCGEELE